MFFLGGGAIDSPPTAGVKERETGTIIQSEVSVLKLSELLVSSELDIDAGSVADADITSVTEEFDSVAPGSIFVCVNGKNYNGHMKAYEAASSGAALVVGEENIDAPRYVRVADARKAVCALSRAFFGKPDKRLKLIGITGTNGKTTTAEYVRHIMTFAGKKCGIIGTLGWDCGDGRVPSERTTPDSFTFFSELKKTADRGCGYCVTEVSSQALSQCRVDCAEFDLAVLTNIGHDHLDYHKTVRDYVAAKKKLFSTAKAGLVNADDAYRDEFAAAADGKTCKLYSAGANLSDYSARSIRSDGKGGSSFILFDGFLPERVSISAPGRIGVYNSLCAASVCMMSGVDAKTAAAALCRLPAVRGRSEMIMSSDGVRVCIDFAHTPEAMSAVLSAIRESTDGKIITVFGCGGDRDATKRPVMGGVASSASDIVILTSDNPRSENPEKIIADIASGVKIKASLFKEPDRHRAIELALEKASAGDTVLVAGKGHEMTQTLKNASVRFSDAETVKDILHIKNSDVF